MVNVCQRSSPFLSPPKTEVHELAATKQETELIQSHLMANVKTAFLLHIGTGA